MAVSAFKSTTRRCGRQGTSASDQEPSAATASPSRTLSDHLTAHHQKMKYHKRSSNYTDISPYSRHSGESPRSRGTRFLERQLSEKDLGKRKPIEGVDCTAAVLKHDDKLMCRLGSPQDLGKHKPIEGVDCTEAVLKHDNKLTYRLGSPQRSINALNKMAQEHPEGQVEEKIIRTVHAQNKPLYSGSFLRDPDELYRIIKAEVFDVVADMEDAIESSQENAVMFDCSACESADKSSTSFSEEIVKVFRYVCKGYAAKVDKVQEEVKQLRSQLVEKEKVCLELINFINDLIPESGAVERLQGKSSKQDKGRRKIFKYLSERGNGVPLTRARSGSILDDDECVQRLSSEQILLELEKEVERGSSSRSQSSCSAAMGVEENKDGLLLPWLQWEEANVQCHSRRKILQHKQECKSQDGYSERVSSCGKEQQAADATQGTTHYPRKDRTDTVTTDHSAGSSIQSVELISERIQFRARVAAGELLLCIGTLHIF